jgi:hypothetical protein
MNIHAPGEFVIEGLSDNNIQYTTCTLGIVVTKGCK